MPIPVTSSAFQEGREIPSRYTCEGEDVSPPLEWGLVPRESQSIALIMDDPGTARGNWVHWVIFNLPPTVHSLPEGMPRLKQLANGEMQGIGSFKKHGYYGPCPPEGQHRYFFKLYALDRPIAEEEEMTKENLEAAMQGHVIGTGQLMGTYTKKKNEGAA
ncbi:MAG: YbhB/YbcL family Raf kinase inhibitor-like protein [Candidatus Omnitrophica bacterium]|nr:YbhB/YbcL family Raf kinase inhibitor-like protein [Candidatus Omnitrophota bacterium]